jgi:hypothetical protein
MKVTNATITPDKLTQLILEEYEYRLMSEHTNKGYVAMTSKMSLKPKGKGKKLKLNVRCGNCKQEGHTDKECWRPGGGAKGQGPYQKKNHKV